MIILDMNQISVASLMMHLHMTKADTVDEDMVRHMILNSVRMYRTMFNQKYGEVVFAWDSRHYWRRDFFPQYKANRGETPEDLIPQFDLIKKSVQAFNIPQLELEGFEADDIIATYTNLAQKLNIPSLIVSSDKDLMQLVNDDVEMLDPMKNKRIGISEVVEKFGVKPDKVIQIQALTGDKIDNIPGAPGIGPKIAAELIKQFGDIEGLIKNVNDIKQEKRKKTIQESKEDIRISLELVKLDKNVKLPISIEKIIPYKKIQNSSEDINKFLLEQGFKAIIQRLENNPFIKKNIDESVNIKEKTKTEFELTLIEYLPSTSVRGSFVPVFANLTRSQP